MAGGETAARRRLSLSGSFSADDSFRNLQKLMIPFLLSIDPAAMAVARWSRQRRRWRRVLAAGGAWVAAACNSVQRHGSSGFVFWDCWILFWLVWCIGSVQFEPSWILLFLFLLLFFSIRIPQRCRFWNRHLWVFLICAAFVVPVRKFGTFVRFPTGTYCLGTYCLFCGSGWTTQCFEL